VLHQLTPEQEQHLVAQACSAPQRVRDLYQHYVSSVYGYIGSRVQHPHDVEDLVSETFVKVFEHFDTFRWQGSQSFSAWLFRIAHNTVQDFQRRGAQHPGAVSLDEVVQQIHPARRPDELIVQDEEAMRLHVLITTLSPRRQEIVRLRFFGNLRNQEIAAVLGLDERTVAAHLCRALSDLYQKYTNEMEDGYEPAK
jgi:RNA polymerase sigma-70 factor (ECF subfamily)